MTLQYFLWIAPNFFLSPVIIPAFTHRLQTVWLTIIGTGGVINDFLSSSFW